MTADWEVRKHNGIILNQYTLGQPDIMFHQQPGTLDSKVCISIKKAVFPPNLWLAGMRQVERGLQNEQFMG